MIASEGPPVDSETANAAPIVNTAAPALGPTLNWEPVPDLPPELQPFPGDILLSRAFWPWDDLGAKGIPEHWLYMSRRVQGTIAMLSVQTPNGPKLANADVTGRLAMANYYDRNPKSIQLGYSHTDAPHGNVDHSIYTVPSGRKAVIELVSLAIERVTAAAPVGRAQAYVTIQTGGNFGFIPLLLNDNTVGIAIRTNLGHSGFLAALDSVTISDFDNSTGGLLNLTELVRLTEFDA